MIGIITGLKFEADLLKKAALKRGYEISLIDSVAGNQTRSFEIAQSFVRKGAKGLVSFGIAGGLSDAASVGSLLLPEVVIDDKGSEFKSDSQWRSRLIEMITPKISVQEGPLISLSVALETETEKRAANQKHGALGVDMESYGVARAAQETEVPFLVIRSISDSVTDTLPSSVIPAMGPEGQIKLKPLVSSIMRRPNELGELIDFGKKTRKANETLRRVCFLGLPLFGL